MGRAAAGVTATLVVGLLVIHNLVTNLWFPEWSYVPVNLATAAVLVAVAGTPLPFGHPALAVAALVLGAIGVLYAVPATRPLLADRRMAGVDARGTAWRALVRIPLGTVVLEEVAFRGILPTVLSPVAAAALFGLWHVVPTFRTLEINGVARVRRAIVAGAVVATALVGMALWELQVRTGGLLAPALVHTAANSGATVAAYLVVGRRLGPCCWRRSSLSWP
jgi:membrane protease YdiL (CAAX protease family)